MSGPPLSGRFEGDRRGTLADVVLQASGPHTLQFQPLLLPAPAGLTDARHWPLARRGWLNAIQPTSRWGEQNRPFSAPPGMLGNNVISDPASCSLGFYADQAFFIAAHDQVGDTARGDRVLEAMLPRQFGGEF